MTVFYSQVQRLLQGGLLVLFLAVMPVLAIAEEHETPNNTEGLFTAQQASVKLPLSQLAGQSGVQRLSGVEQSMSWGLPVPALWQPDTVTLHVNGTISEALINSSQLQVLLAGKVIAQQTLDGRQSRLQMRVDVPVTELTPGFNAMQLRVVQHYTEKCEYPMAPQLWTEIDLAASYFDIVASPRQVTGRLSQLSRLFDKASWQANQQITVFSEQSENSEHLAALGFVAQGIGQRYDYIPTRIQHQPLPASRQALSWPMADSQRVAILMGRFEMLADIINVGDYQRAGGPVLALQTLPGLPSRYLLLVMGETDEQVRQAAASFAIPGVPWPNSHWASIDSLTIPTENALEKRFSLPTAGQGAFPLRALGYQNQTLTGIDSAALTLPVWNNTWQGRMQVRLHLAYASGMATQSALNVKTNGVLNGSIPLNNPQGGIYENYAVTIPAGLMKPGWNQLSFEPVMIPQSHGGECQPFFPGNLALTIYEDSTIQKFGGDELQRLDLASLNGSGYLFTEQPLGKGIAFHMTDTDSATLSAAMTLMGKLSQVYKRPLLNSRFALAGDSHEADDLHYWVGRYAALPENLQSSLQLALPDNVAIDVPLMQSATVQVHEGAEWFNTGLDTLGLRKTPPANVTQVGMQLQGDFGRNGFALSARDKAGKPHIVFTAEDSALLKDTIDTVVDYGHWGQLRGGLSFWSPGGRTVYAVSYDEAPFSAYGLRGGLGLWVSQYPWRALFILLGLTGLMVWLSRKLLKQYQQRNQQNS